MTETHGTQMKLKKKNAKISTDIKILFRISVAGLFRNPIRRVHQLYIRLYVVFSPELESIVAVGFVFTYVILHCHSMRSFVLLFIRCSFVFYRFTDQSFSFYERSGKYFRLLPRTVVSKPRKTPLLLQSSSPSVATSSW